MKILLSIVRYLFLILAAVALMSVLDRPTTLLYQIVFPYQSGSGLADIDLTPLATAIFGLYVLIPLLFTWFGERFRYWAVGCFIVITTVPAVLIKDQYIGINVLIILTSAVVGFLIRSIVSHTLGKMPALEGYKKYF